MKSMLSAHLSLPQSVSLMFAEISLLLVFGEEVPKIRYFVSFLESFIILLSSKQFEGELL